MSIYEGYLPELRSTTLFRDMTDREILLVLDAMRPPIRQGRPSMDAAGTPFRMVLRSTPPRVPAPRFFTYDMPAFGEPGMLMAEIPALSRLRDHVKTQGGPPPGHAPKVLDFQLETLEFDPEMITRFYRPEVSAAQGKMLRNFLGILAQKVCDVRQELFLLRDGRDLYGGLTLADDAVLHVLTAGVAMKTVAKVARVWNALHPELPAACRVGGSVDLARRVREGQPCDVLIMADGMLIRDLLVPDHAEGYRIFAGNKMVITGSREHPISAADWKEKLLAPDSTFGHHNPYGDPAGYRAVMAMLLANGIEEGLGDRLMDHPGHQGMERQPGPDLEPPRYAFGYYSGAVGRGLPFAELPAAMDLSAEALAGTYATARFAIDEAHVVTGAPIAHALTLPRAAGNREAAREFGRLFMKTDFGKEGFLERNGCWGADPLA
jgi:ABC-type molybdate transport system substrate-binding protein